MPSLSFGPQEIHRFDSLFNTSRTPLMTTNEVCELIGVSYRFAHGTVNRGVLVPTVRPRGSGSQMKWSKTDAKVLLALRILSRDVHVGGGGIGGRGNRGWTSRQGLRTYVAAIRTEIDRDPTARTLCIERGRVRMLLDLVPAGAR